MEFKQISIEDKPVIDKYLKAGNLGISEHCFTTIFMWQEYYNTKFFEDGEFLYLKSNYMHDGRDYFICPVGFGRLEKAIAKLHENFGDEIQIVSITDEAKQAIEKAMPNHFDFTEMRDAADYVYLAERLRTLSGKKLQLKRNFVNRFLGKYGDDYSFERITAKNKHKVWEFHLGWSKKSDNEEQARSLVAETAAIRRVLDNYEALGVLGGILYVDKEVAGFTVATQATEELAVVHIEKCNTNFAGVYQMINKTFVEAELADMVYINREEDMGIEGLRKAKLSYRPEVLRMKFTATVRR